MTKIPSQSASSTLTSSSIWLDANGKRGILASQTSTQREREPLRDFAKKQTFHDSFTYRVSMRVRIQKWVGAAVFFFLKSGHTFCFLHFLPVNFFLLLIFQFSEKPEVPWNLFPQPVSPNGTPKNCFLLTGRLKINRSIKKKSVILQPLMLKNGSGYLKSKWEGECAVREEFPEATIVRPADIYGQEDRAFINSYTQSWRRHFRWESRILRFRRNSLSPSLRLRLAQFQGHSTVEKGRSDWEAADMGWRCCCWNRRHCQRSENRWTNLSICWVSRRFEFCLLFRFSIQWLPQSFLQTQTIPSLRAGRLDRQNAETRISWMGPSPIEYKSHSAVLGQSLCDRADENRCSHCHCSLGRLRIGTCPFLQIIALNLTHQRRFRLEKFFLASSSINRIEYSVSFFVALFGVIRISRNQEISWHQEIRFFPRLWTMQNFFT